MSGAYTDNPASSIAAATCLGTVIAAAADEMVVICSSGGRASAATTFGIERKVLQRSTGGATPTANTPGQLSTRAGAPQVTFDATWTTAPTVSGNPIVHIAAPMKHENTLWWRPPRPWAAIALFNAEQLNQQASASASGVQTLIHDSAGMGRGSKDLNRLPNRRPRRRGIWFYRCHSNKQVTATSPAYTVHRRTEYAWCARVW